VADKSPGKNEVEIEKIKADARVSLSRHKFFSWVALALGMPLLALALTPAVGALAGQETRVSIGVTLTISVTLAVSTAVASIVASIQRKRSGRAERRVLALEDRLVTLKKDRDAIEARNRALQGDNDALRGDLAELRRRGG
jgi:hypothetical protein